MSKIFQAFSNKTNLNLKTLKFSFDGLGIEDSATPEDLELEDEDLIDVVVKK